VLKRVPLLIAFSLVVVGTAVGPAVAGGGWGWTECGQNPHPGCELGAGSGDRHPAPAPEKHNSPGRDGASGTGGGDAQPVKPKFSNPDLNLASCSYERSDYAPPPSALQASYDGEVSGGGVVAVAYNVRPVAEPKPGELGAWYVYRCAAGGVRDALYRPPVWIPDGQRQAGGVPLPSPLELAQLARDQLRLPSPRIEASPAAEQLVNLPTWLWLDRGMWGAVSATASVPGVSVTAVARPVSVEWAMGDGSTVTCAGPGTPYGIGGNPQSPSPDCGYTYRRSSAGRPGGTFAVSATVDWTVTWSGAGQSGVFPGLTTTSGAGFAVAESQALNSDG